MTRLLVILAALAFSATASAQLYKWVDKDGKVQYGDNPPPNTKTTRLKPPPGAPTQPSAAAGDKKDKALSPDAAFRKRQQERSEQDQKAEKERATADQKKQNCDTAQANLRQLQSGQRISSINAAGERVFLDDAQLGERTQRAQNAVAEWCK
jgi:hypothetical protein